MSSRAFFRVVWGAACLAVTAPAFGQNLVSNGSFETGYNSGWNHLSGNGGSATYSEETADPHEGSKALKAEITALGANSWDVQTLGPTVSLTPGADYTLTFWGKALAAGTSVKMVLQSTVFKSQTSSLATNWTQYTWNFTASETSPQLKMHYIQTGTVWLDDIQIMDPGSGAAQITISPATTYQTMDGFGGALSWYANRIYNGSAANAAEIEQLMFSDCGLDIVRFKNWYYPVGYPSSTDPNNVTEQSSYDAIEDLYSAAKAANTNIQVLLSSWSPPASLKSNGDRKNGGTLASDVDGYMYDELAQYWVDFFDNVSWDPDYLSFQNEPGYSATWESCLFHPTESASRAGYAEAVDAIWNVISNRTDVPKMVGSEAENMPSFLNFNAALLSRAFIDVHGYHVYDIGNEGNIDSGTTISRLNNIRDSYGDRPNWMTEFSNGFGWLAAARVIHNTVVEANASAYIYWKLAWQEGGDPDQMISVASDGSYTVNAHYYAVKHYAKHVHKGYRRISVSGGTADIKTSGFLSPAGASVTLVVINKATAAADIELIPDSFSAQSVVGYQSTAGSYYQSMSGLSVSNPIALPGESITTLVLSLSPPPAFDSDPVVETNATEDAAYSASLVDNASDPDGGPLSFSKLSGPFWLNVATNGVLSGTPGNADVGTNEFTVSVSSVNGSDAATLRIEVLNVNDPPTWNSNLFSGVSAIVEIPYASSIAGEATDVDAGASLTFAKAWGPPWLTVASDGALTGIPSYGDIGLNSFTVTVSDAIAPAVAATLDIEVVAPPPFEGETLGLIYNWASGARTATNWTSTLPASDTETQWLFASGMSIEGTGAGGTSISNAYRFGPDDAAVTVSMGDLWPAATFELWIKPDSLSGDRQTIFETGGSYKGFSLTLWTNVVKLAVKRGTEEQVDDPDVVLSRTLQPGEADDFIQLIALFDGAGSELHVNPVGVSGIAVGTADDSGPAADWSGTGTSGLGCQSAADNLGGGSSSPGSIWYTESFTNFNGFVGHMRVYTNALTAQQIQSNYVAIVGSLPPTNNAPTFTSNPIGGADATAGTPYSGSIAGDAVDPDDDPLTFAKESGPEWLNVSAGGALTGLPSASDVGLNSFIVSVSDGTAPAVQAGLLVTVNPEATLGAATLFVDDFANDVVADSRDIPAFWSVNTSGADMDALVESGGVLTMTTGSNDGGNDGSYSGVRIFSETSPDFSFFDQPLVYSVRGVTFDDHGTGIADSSEQLRFALLAEGNNSYAAEDSVAVKITPNGTLRFGAKQNNINAHAEDSGAQVVTGLGTYGVYGFDLMLGPAEDDTKQEYRLQVYTGAVPVSVAVKTGRINLSRAEWGAGSGDAKLLLWSQEYNVNGGNQYYDTTVSDVRVESSGNLLFNPGFELGDTSGWEKFPPPPNSTDAILSMETTTVYEGSYACRVSSRSASWHSVRRPIDGVMTVGETYTLAIWARLGWGQPDSASLQVKVVDDAHPTGKYTTVDTKTLVSDAWTELRGEYTYDCTGSLSEAFFYVGGVEASVDLLVDDSLVSLYIPPPALATVIAIH